MALFNFRKNADLNNSGSANPEPVESVEVLRKKTLHRLIGSAVLVIIGVIVFSLVFDRQPRPIPVDIAIQIPSQDGQAPLVIATPTAVSAPVAASAPAPEAASAPAAVSAVSAPAPVPVSAAMPAPVVVPAKASLAAKEEIVPSGKPAAAAPAAKDTKPEPAKAAMPLSDAQRAKDLLEGKAPAAVDGPRYIVQVGAFADAAKARQTRQKVEKAGLKTYTQVAETGEGKRIRVRVGPFATRDEAEKVAKKIKSLDLPVAILTL